MFSLLLVHYALPPTEVGVATVSVGESLCETTFRRMLDEDYLSDQKVGIRIIIIIPAILSVPLPQVLVYLVYSCEWWERAPVSSYRYH